MCNGRGGRGRKCVFLLYFPGCTGLVTAAAGAAELGMLVRCASFFGSKTFLCKYNMHSETCINHKCAENVHKLNTPMWRHQTKKQNVAQAAPGPAGGHYPCSKVTLLTSNSLESLCPF